MKHALPLILGSLAAAVLAGCAQLSDVDADFKAAAAAPRPTSADAAERAVVAYFAPSLPDAATARYAFDPPTNGVLHAPGRDEAGWFMCGVVSLKEASGNYGLVRPVLAHFDPAAPDSVKDGAVEYGDFSIVQAQCRALYGTLYLPSYEPHPVGALSAALAPTAAPLAALPVQAAPATE